jgi:monoamine oxidase
MCQGSFWSFSSYLFKMRFIKAALFRLISIVVLASGECPDPGTTDKDVVIIGAGMAGLYVGKTLMEVDPNLDFVVLESNTRVGGRMHTTTFGTKADGGTYNVEVGANWFADTPDNFALSLAREYGIDMTLQDFFDFLDSTYEYDHEVKVSDRKGSHREMKKLTVFSPRLCNYAGFV